MSLVDIGGLDELPLGVREGRELDEDWLEAKCVGGVHLCAKGEDGSGTRSRSASTIDAAAEIALPSETFRYMALGGRGGNNTSVDRLRVTQLS